jgi:hypothetical protein
MAYTVTNNPWSSQYNVGIGIETPCSTLHVFGAGATMRLGPYYADQDRDYLFFEAGGTNSQIITRNESMTIHNCGGPLILNPSGQCVGIGTSSPSTILNVASSAPIIRLNPTTQNNPSAIEFGVLNSGNNAYAKIDATNTINYDTNLRFFTNGVGSTTQVERMRITYNGNVGIGTCAPSMTLSILGAKQGDVNEGQGQLLIDGDVAYNAANGSTLCQSGAGSVIIFRGKYDTAGNITGFAGIAGSKENTTDGNYGGNLRFYTRTHGANNPCEWMRITNTGNTGINTTSPSYRLHVNGTFYAAGSSQDYKTSICQYDTNSCMFMKLKPVTYQYKEEYCHLGKELKSGTQIGLIAEEVAETYPELAILVKENDNDVVRNVDYEKLSIVLLAEVQKLRKEVDDLKTK